MDKDLEVYESSNSSVQKTLFLRNSICVEKRFAVNSTP